MGELQRYPKIRALSVRLPGLVRATRVASQSALLVHAGFYDQLVDDPRFDVFD